MIRCEGPSPSLAEKYRKMSLVRSWSECNFHFWVAMNYAQWAGCKMLSMACSADAFRLTKRCRADGFTKIRQGLTKPERMISKAVTLKTAQFNSKSSRMSDKHYVKRHLHYIARVKKDDPRKPLALFTHEFNLTNLDGTVTFKLTNMIRKTNTYCKQAPESEQRPPNTIGSLNLPFEWSYAN